MTKTIKELEPKALWNYFHGFNQIPRPSKHEEKAVEYIVNFAKEHHLEYFVDEVSNVIVRKKAYPGMEHKKGVIMQAHLDMVPQKNNDKKHDFLTDPIVTLIDGEWVKADGTTLGADNAIGASAALAVLASKDIKHGPVEALFTIDEETGMTGAVELKPGVLKGEILLNMDSEDEGELYVGCAGGLDALITLDYTTDASLKNYTPYQVKVGGLKGGHSGLDIILQRGNASKILVRLLQGLSATAGARVAGLKGGDLRNAIPREAEALIWMPQGDFSKALDLLVTPIYKELEFTDPGLEIKIIPSDSTTLPMSLADQAKILGLLDVIPNGVVRMSDTMTGMVETSTNMGILKVEHGKVQISCLLRSFSDAAKDELGRVMQSAAALAGAQCRLEGGYPGWKPNPSSAIVAHMKQVYLDHFGREPEVKAIHAGLECGILGATYPHWDMVSFGPTIRFPHSPDEKVNIESVQKFWDYLVLTLERL